MLVLNIPIWIFLNILCMTVWTSKGIPIAPKLRVQTTIPEKGDFVSRSMHYISTNITQKLEKYKFSGGLVSVDCLRCLCLVQSNCEPIGCRMLSGWLLCGYFLLSYNQWEDCKTVPGITYDWRKCSNDIKCSSQCIQNYMAMYVKQYHYVNTCEGFSRELFGGPNGCNDPSTLKFWNSVQEVPGCKGVK